MSTSDVEAGRRAPRRAIALAALLPLLAACGTLSVAEERQLGRQFEEEAQRSFKFLRDRTVKGYVQRIGEAIVRASAPHPFQYTFDVIEDDEINAFAGPAGHIYVNTGTILAARNVSELAGVIGHEVGHVAKRHIAHNYNRQRTTGLAHQAAVVLTSVLGGSAAGGATNLLGGIAGTAYLNSFTREAEAEADGFAIQVLPAAGYDPTGMVEKESGGVHVPDFLRSHPTPESRILATRAAIAELSLPAGLEVHDQGRLEIIQRRIRILLGED